MFNIKYTDCADFRCLEDLNATSMELYLVHAGLEHTKPQHVFSQSRSEYIIHFVLSGKGTYSVNGNNWTVTAGQMFLIYPDEPVTYVSDPDNPWYYAWIGFNGMRSEHILKSCGFSHTIRVLPCPGPEITLKSVEKLLDYRRLVYSNDLKRTSCLMYLLSELIDFHASTLPQKILQTDYSPNVYVEHAIDFIRHYYTQGINVTDVVDYVGISRAHLNNSFQKELGMSVQKFLIDFRMHKAANLLMSTTDSINEISHAVGYEDALTFSKAFKKKFDVSPKIYREQRIQLKRYDLKQT